MHVSFLVIIFEQRHPLEVIGHQVMNKIMNKGTKDQLVPVQ